MKQKLLFSNYPQVDIDVVNFMLLTTEKDVVYRVNFGHSIRYFFNWNLHREDGPAIEWPDGSTEWYFKGNLHRKNGPAIELANGIQQWWLHGIRFK